MQLERGRKAPRQPLRFPRDRDFGQVVTRWVQGPWPATEPYGRKIPWVGLRPAGFRETRRRREDDAGPTSPWS